MVGILVVAHGALAESLVAALTHVLGTRPPQLAA
jgi:mannose/fructose-specific phosphotransferase system component IIA